MVMRLRFRALGHGVRGVVVRVYIQDVSGRLPGFCGVWGIGFRKFPNSEC